MRQRFITYLTWMGDDMITVPDFPSWVCDVCGRREYDPMALNRLNLLLNPHAGRPTTARPKGFSPSSDTKIDPPANVAE